MNFIQYAFWSALQGAHVDLALRGVPPNCWTRGSLWLPVACHGFLAGLASGGFDRLPAASWLDGSVAPVFFFLGLRSNAAVAFALRPAAAAATNGLRAHMCPAQAFAF